MVDLKGLMLQAADIADARLRTGMKEEHALHDKGDKDFALALDLAIERELKALLEASGIPVLGEELAWQGEQDAARYWVIDPIDGTINFARGVPLCGLCIALVEDGQATMACISLPFLNERYVAERGLGAYLNNQRIHVADTNSLNTAMVSCGDFAVGANAIERNRLRLALVHTLAPRIMRLRMLGSAAVQLAWLATGRLDVSVILSNKPWDVLAGVLIVREAGGEVFDGDGRTHSADSRYTLATCNETLKSEVLTALQQAEEITV